MRRWLRIPTILLMVATGGWAVASAWAGAQTPSPSPSDEQQQQRSEVISERSMYAKTFREPDGTYTKEISTHQVHFRGGGGRWEEIDPTLEPCPDPGCAYQNRKGPFSVRFAALGSESDVIAIRDGQFNIAYGLEGAAPTPGRADGNEITYDQIRPGIDMEFELGSSFVKKRLIVHAPPLQPLRFRFPLSLTGLEARQTVDGYIVLETPAGKTIYTIPRPYMTDTPSDGNSDEGAFSEDVRFELEGSPGSQVLSIVPDHSWLTAPDRNYPVTIDPDVTKNATKDTFIQSNILNTSQATAKELKAGTYDGGSTKARSLFRFDIESLRGSDVVINSAKLSVQETHAWSCTKTPIQVRRIDGPWDASVTWPNRPPLASYAWAEISEARGYSADCPADRIEFGVKDLLLSWLDYTHPNQGLALRAADETKNFQWKKFASIDAVRWPQLLVNYNTKPGKPTQLQPDGTVVADTTPTLSGVYHDPDDGDGGHLRFQIFAADDLGNPVATTDEADHGGFAEPGQESRWTVPASMALSDGVYKWRARGFDGNEWSEWTDLSAHSFTVELGPPPAPRALRSTSHVPYVAFKDRAIDMRWDPPSTTSRDIAGYSWELTGSETAAVDATVEEDGVNSTRTTATAPADGTFWFHIVTVDTAGNKSEAATYGPIVIDQQNGAGLPLTPTLPLGEVIAPQSDEMGLEQFYPYRSTELGTATAFAQLRTGNLVVQSRAIEIPGQGLNTLIRHTYNAGRAAAGYHDTGVGRGWVLSVSDADSGIEGMSDAVTSVDVNSPIVASQFVDDALQVTGFVLEFTDGDGTVHRFVQPDAQHGGRWESPPGVALRLREVDDPATVTPVDAYELVRPDGVVYRADNQTLAGQDLPAYFIVSITDRNGNRLTFDYKELAISESTWPTTQPVPLTGVRVASITHSRAGEIARFHYDEDAGAVSGDDQRVGDVERVVILPGVSAVDPALGSQRSFERTIEYLLDGEGLLKRVTENPNDASPQPVPAASRTTTYAYADAGDDVVINDALGLGDPRLLEKITDGRGNSTLFTYEEAPQGSPATLGLAATEPVRVRKVTDRRANDWTYNYGDADGGVTTTTLTTPLGSSTSYTISARGAISTTDNRVAGGNITRIEDAGAKRSSDATSVAPIVSRFEWEQNLLVKTIEGSAAESATNTTEHFYNDLRLLTKVVSPPPNDPARTDLPSGAPATPIDTAFDYDAVSSGNYENCSQPAGSSSPHVSTDGYCATVAEMKQARYADNIDAQRRISDFSHDSNGNMTRVVHRASHAGTQSTTDPEHLDAPSDPRDRVTTFTYHERGLLASVDGPRQDADDVATFGNGTGPEFGYHRSGQPLIITDPFGEVKRFEYTPYGMIGKIVDRAGKVTTALYDSRDNVVESTDAEGAVTRFRYDDNDNRTLVVSPRGTATAASGDYQTTLRYNNNDQAETTSTPGAAVGDAPSVSSTTYNEEGNVKTRQSPVAGSETTYSYYPNEQLREVSAPTGTGKSAVTTYFYDGRGRLQEIQAPTIGGGRPRSLIEFAPTGGESVVTATSDSGALDRRTSFAYNAHGEQLQVRGPRSVAQQDQLQEQDYNPFGEVTEMRVLNRRADQTTNEWLRYLYEYDHSGNTTVHSQPLKDATRLTTKYTYDALNRLISQTDPHNPGHRTDFEYLPEGQQSLRKDVHVADVGTTELRRAQTVYNDDYTVASVVATDSDPENGTNDNLALCNFRDGNLPGTGYDADNNLLFTRTVRGGDCDTGTIVRSRALSYDQRGWLSSQLQVVKPPGQAAELSRTQSFKYRQDGVLLWSTWTKSGIDGFDKKTEYLHSAGGALETLTDWRGAKSTFDYLDAGALKTATFDGNLATGTLSYHPDGSMKSLQWASGATTIRSHTGMDYDVGGLLRSETVTVDPVEDAHDDGGTASFTYDLVGRLTGWTSPFPLEAGSVEPNSTETSFHTSYSLDDAGNIEGENITSAGGTPLRDIDYTYGTTGRLEARSVVDHGMLNDGVETTTNQTFTYSRLGEETSRESTTVAPGFADAVTVTATTYDAMGHTDEATSTGTGAPPDINYDYAADSNVTGRHKASADTLYFYFGLTDTLAEETDASGTTKVTYLVTPSGTQFAQQKNGAWTWLLSDPEGSVATHLRADGEVVAQRSYDPYGKELDGGTTIKKDDPETDANEALGTQSTLGYQGSHTDEDTGNLLLGPRIYDPTTERFTSPDFFVAGATDMAFGTDPLTGNRYLFAAANPVAFYENGYVPTCDSGPCAGPMRNRGVAKTYDRDFLYDTATLVLNIAAPIADNLTGGATQDTRQLLGVDYVDERNAYYRTVHTGTHVAGVIVPGPKIIKAGKGPISSGFRALFARMFRAGATRAASETTELALRNSISIHAAEQMAERGISAAMVRTAVTKGTRYYDFKNQTISHVLEGGFASGRTLQVGVNPYTGVVTTAISRRRFNPQTLLPSGNPRYVLLGP